MSRITIGIIGLGIMGRAYATHLQAAGFRVAGHDVADAAFDVLDADGIRCATPAAVAAEAEVILTALPSVTALKAVTDSLGPALRPGTVVAEMSTFPIDAKQAAADAIAASGATLLDCPVSGTGAQAANRDLVVYTSGDVQAIAKARPAFEAISRQIIHVGDFGAGMKMKFIANHLVTIHNLAAAEALVLAEQAGLDLQLTYEAISSGAGSSRMFEVRGPMMVRGEYEPATMRQEVYAKDLALIMDFAEKMNAPVPLMAASLPYYAAARAQGRGKEDTAAVHGVLRDMTSPKSRGE